jgi:hypothetical protein
MVTANANTNVHIYNPFVEEPNGILKVKNLSLKLRYK